MIKREKYLKPIRAFYDSDLVKVITGIRRSGKSVFFGTIRKEIEARSNNIIALDFEDVETQLTITDSLSLVNPHTAEGRVLPTRYSTNTSFREVECLSTVMH